MRRLPSSIVGPLLCLVLSAGCGSEDPAPLTPDPVPAGSAIREQFTYQMVLYPNSYAISGPRFTTKAAGPVEITATFTPVPELHLGIDLLYVGKTPAHNEGSGGPSSMGYGGTLTGRWVVGFVGDFEARISPMLMRTPLPVPPQGVVVPVTFTIQHP